MTLPQVLVKVREEPAGLVRVDATDVDGFPLSAPGMARKFGQLRRLHYLHVLFPRAGCIDRRADAILLVVKLRTSLQVGPARFR